MKTVINVADGKLLISTVSSYINSDLTLPTCTYFSIIDTIESMLDYVISKWLIDTYGISCFVKIPDILVNATDKAANGLVNILSNYLLGLPMFLNLLNNFDFESISEISVKSVYVKDNIHITTRVI